MSQNELLFKLGEAREVYTCPILVLEERSCQTPDLKISKNVFTFRCNNWVNVVPVTNTGNVVLVEQMRFGTAAITFETPGGAIDAGESNPAEAALRELQEETRLSSSNLQALGGFPANPAIENNLIYYYLAFDVKPEEHAAVAHDPFERVRVHYVPWREAISMARDGRIAHALCSLAILLAEPYLRSKFEN